MGTIYVVDHRPEQRVALERLLQTAGHEVESFSSAAEMLGQLDQRAADLVLLEALPHATKPFECIERLRARESSRATGVIVLAGDGAPEDAKIQALEVGADDYLSEPISNVELLAKARALMRNKLAQDELRRANVQLAAMLEIAQAINTLDLRSLAEQLVELTLEATELELGGLWILEHGELICLAQRGYSEGFMTQRRHLQLDQTELFRRALDERVPIYGRTVELYSQPHPVAGELGWVLVTPLIARLPWRLPVGLIQLGRREDRPLTPGAISFVLGVANLAADAVQNARLYEETEQQRRQLADLDRQKDEFISLASHELKNPMASIKGYAGLLLRRASRDPELKAKLKGVELIDQQIGRMTSLLDQLLDVSRIGMDRFVIDPQTRDLAAVVRRQVEGAQAGTNNHTLSFICGEPALECEFDAYRISQVVEILISNAIKYSPKGGPVEVALYREGESVRLTVSDRGIGIPEDQQAQLFNRFFRAANAMSSFAGLGLGLYVAREIVQRHGGTIEAASQEGQGTLVTIMLPISLPAELRAEQPDGTLVQEK